MVYSDRGTERLVDFLAICQFQVFFGSQTTRFKYPLGLNV